MPIQFSHPRPIANCKCRPTHFLTTLDGEEVPVIIGLDGLPDTYADGTVLPMSSPRYQEALDSEAVCCPACGADVDWED